MPLLLYFHLTSYDIWLFSYHDPSVGDYAYSSVCKYISVLLLCSRQKCKSLSRHTNLQKTLRRIEDSNTLFPSLVKASHLNSFPLSDFLGVNLYATKLGPFPATTTPSVDQVILPPGSPLVTLHSKLCSLPSTVVILSYVAFTIARSDGSPWWNKKQLVIQFKGYVSLLLLHSVKFVFFRKNKVARIIVKNWKAPDDCNNVW